MKKVIQFFAVTAISSLAFGQQSFTIDESWQYAIDHNVAVQKAKIDRTIADQKVKETIGIGLPQISGQAKYNYYLKIPVTLIDASQFPGSDAPPGTVTEFPMGLKHNANAGLTLTQLIFNGSYLVGLQSSKAFKETMALAEEKTQISIKEGILMSYTAVLVVDENIKTLEENRKVAEKALNDTRETYQLGLIEFQNVEQQEYSYKSLLANQQNLTRDRKKLMMTLKYLMGYPLDQPISLSSSLDELIQKNEGLVDLENQLDLNNHIDYRLKQNQLKLNELKLRLQKSYALPSLSGFANTAYNTGNNQFKIFDTNNRWFNSTILGLQLDVPIFSGFQRHWQTEQAKLDLKKSQLDLQDMEKTLKNNAYSASVDYDNAYNSYKNALELIKLSSSIYNKQQIKFKEGMGSSFDLQQAETQLYNSQAQYYQSALNLIQAKTKLDEALGKL
ncbi:MULTISPECIES: TolC family protein [Chryseobacterium]|uniref:TolC family protein n=1 Tax=Chryseobacterium sp. R2A-55 TaxID=2744445 RepID=UPI001F3BF938|nr:TolC family protein [Chryseobacterium sp. R2A-55]